jgi:hypothetical protein
MEPVPVAAPDLMMVSDDEEDQLISQTKRSRRQEKIWKVTMVQRWRKKSKSKMKQLRK